MWGPWAPLGPPPLPPRALREGGEEGVAEGLALMRERRLPPSGVPWWVERVETVERHVHIMIIMIVFNIIYVLM